MASPWQISLKPVNRAAMLLFGESRRSKLIVRYECENALVTGSNFGFKVACKLLKENQINA
ncbi:hypothetical protein NQ318_003547 [Aromia moschata]|uniref:Uncharacterized protein n=1 Tax=Aromia moschata TaxID=1265417 RepID=A0AAV8YXK7_9CUCU|nr:hypothetical protein NQ318_003547 [Aromia moschata]